MRAACPTHLSLHDLFAVMIFGGARLKLLIPHFLRRAVNVSLCQIQIFSTASCSEKPSVSNRRFVHVKKFCTDKKQERSVIILYILSLLL